jgi:ATP phosphoribosyltransferase
VVEEIVESTGRLVVNRASYQLKSEAITELVKALETVVNAPAIAAVSGEE